MRRSRGFTANVLALLAAVVAFAAASPAARPAPPGSGGESPSAPPPRAAKVGGLDSRLAAIARAGRARGRTAALDQARKQGLAVGQAGVQVVIEAGAGAASGTKAAIEAAGGQVDASYANLVEASLPPTALDTVARAANVRFVRRPFLHAEEAATSEGVATTDANAWQAAGADGTGVKVAIIDLGFAGYAQRQAEGELPASLTTVDFCSGNFGTATPHGTAVAEIVHELAPGAQLYLICVDTEVSLGKAEQYAKANGIRIVNHSVAWFDTSRGDGSGGPGTPDAIVADARANGILWVNAAGNYAQSHWSGVFKDSTGNGFNDFSSSPLDKGNRFFLPAGAQACATLKWDDWPVSAQDYDLYLYRSTDSVNPVASSENFQNGTQPPTEELCYTNPGTSGSFYLSIFRFSATATPRFDLFLLGSSTLQYQTPAGSVTEPASSPSAMAVGATCWQSNGLEAYSSRGPTIDGRTKPDIAGPDSVSSATYGPFSSCGASGFTGTSASAPHVAAAAALELQRNPSSTPAQLQAALEGQAIDLGAPGKDSSFGAGELTLPPPPAAVTGAAGGLTFAAATLAGTASANGSAASAFFQYGPTTAYGSSTPVQALGSGAGSVSVPAALTGLVPGSTYHFRLVVQNGSFGEVDGADAVFSTPPLPPPAIGSPADGLSATDGRLTVTGTGAPGATLSLLDGTSVLATTTVDGTGAWSAPVVLALGVHSLSATQTLSGATSAAGNKAAVRISPPPPAIGSPADGFAGTNGNLTVTGTGVPGATLSLLDGASALATTTVSGAGAWSAAVVLGFGAHSLSATQTASTVTSAAGNTVGVTISPPPPTIGSPADGSTSTSGKVTVTGTGVSGATVVVRDGAAVLATVTVDSTGAWSAAVALAVGTHSLTATQSVSGVTGAASNAVGIRINMPPVGVGLGGGVPVAGPAGDAYVALGQARDALSSMASNFAGPYPREYVNDAVTSLTVALDPVHWTPAGLALNSVGQQGLDAMRMAAGWLAWADPAVSAATASQQLSIVSAMGLIARGRFNDVFTLAGQGSGASSWALWVAEYYLHAGDAAAAGGAGGTAMQASLYYTSSWQSLIAQPPCC